MNGGDEQAYFNHFTLEFRQGHPLYPDPVHTYLLDRGGVYPRAMIANISLSLSQIEKEVISYLLIPIA